MALIGSWSCARDSGEERKLHAHGSQLTRADFRHNRDRVRRLSQRVPDAFFAGIRKLVFWIALPALLVNKLTNATFDLSLALRATLVMLGVSTALIVIAYIAIPLLRLPGRSRAAYVQGGVRGNLAFVGLPVVIYAVSASSGPESASLETLALLVLALTVH